MVTHNLMMYSERRCKPQDALVIWLLYPLLCSWLPSTALFLGHAPTSGLPCLPLASQQSLTHMDSVFRLLGKEASTVSGEVSDQLRLDLLQTLAKPPNSLGLDFCHMSSGGNIRHCLCSTELTQPVTLTGRHNLSWVTSFSLELSWVVWVTGSNPTSIGDFSVLGRFLEQQLCQRAATLPIHS